jgi:hypothetical protein
MPRRVRKLNNLTTNSVDWLNYVNASDLDNLSHTKKRRIAHRDSVYDLPVSPERPQKARQTEPKTTTRILRSKAHPGVAQTESSSSSFNNEEDREPNDAESELDGGNSEPNNSESAPIQTEHDNNGEEDQAEIRHNSGSEDELDPFLRPIELFEGYGEQGEGYEDKHGDKDEDEDESEDQNRDEATDESDNSSGGYSSSEDQTKSTSTRIPRVSVEVQISNSTVQNQKEFSNSIHAPNSDLQSSLVAPSPQEIPETLGDHQSLPHELPANTHPIFIWLSETIQESGFKEIWETMVNTRKITKSQADPSMKERFNHIRKMTYRLRGFYKTMTETATPEISTQRDWRKQCSLIANNIFKEIQWIIYDEAQSDEVEGAMLVQQLEAHIVPLLIELVLFGFQTYMAKGDWTTRHFCISLDLLWGCSYKISTFADMASQMGCDFAGPSQKLMPRVKTIKDAVNAGRLCKSARGMPHRHPTYKHFNLTEVESHISCGPWTRVEKDALRSAFESARMDGLNGTIVSFFPFRSF